MAHGARHPASRPRAISDDRPSLPPPLYGPQIASGHGQIRRLIASAEAWNSGRRSTPGRERAYIRRPPNPSIWASSRRRFLAACATDWAEENPATLHGPVCARSTSLSRMVRQPGKTLPLTRKTLLASLVSGATRPGPLILPRLTGFDPSGSRPSCGPTARDRPAGNAGFLFQPLHAAPRHFPWQSPCPLVFYSQYGLAGRYVDQHRPTMLGHRRARRSGPTSI